MRLLTSAPVLGLPDETQDFTLYVHEKSHCPGDLTQTVGPWECPVTYQSKPLDPVVPGRPPCFWALAATVILAREAHKLTLGQYVKVPHAVPALVNKEHKWLTNSMMVHYQQLLCKNSRVQLETVRTLNSTSFYLQKQEPQHNCEELIDEIYSSSLHLMDIPI